MEYGKSLAERIKDMLKSNLPEGAVKTWWEGDPIILPQSALPAIAIETESSDFTLATKSGIGNQDNIEQVTIKVIVNKKDDFGKAPDQVVGHRTLREITIGRDPSNPKRLHDQSIVGILLTNYTLNSNIYNNEITVRFGVVPRPEADLNGEKFILTAEAHVQCTLRDLIEIPTRT